MWTQRLWHHWVTYFTFSNWAHPTATQKTELLQKQWQLDSWPTVSLSRDEVIVGSFVSFIVLFDILKPCSFTLLNLAGVHSSLNINSVLFSKQHRKYFNMKIFYNYSTWKEVSSLCRTICLCLLCKDREMTWRSKDSCLMSLAEPLSLCELQFLCRTVKIQDIKLIPRNVAFPLRTLQFPLSNGGGQHWLEPDHENIAPRQGERALLEKVEGDKRRCVRAVVTARLSVIPGL